jgi:hypothetical protein
MSTKLNEIKVTNEAGEEAKMSRTQYIKHIVETLEVQPYAPDAETNTPPDEVVLYVLKTYEDGKAVDDEFAAEYGQLVAQIEMDYTATVGTKETAKAAKEAEALAKKEAKEKADKEKAEKEALIVKTQGEFVATVESGIEVAQQEYSKEVKTISDSLPAGITTFSDGQGIGIRIAEGTTKEQVGMALGYISQKSKNSAFLGNQMLFWAGDIINATVELGIYATAKDAATHIANTLSQDAAKRIQPNSLAQYSLMSKRTPVSKRNPKADISAYLAVSSLGTLKKLPEETDDKFKARLKQFEDGKEAIQDKLASGEVLARGEVLEPVNQLLIDVKVRKPKDENKVNVSELLQYFFHLSFAEENLLSSIVENEVHYLDKTDLTKTIVLTKAEVEEKKAEIFAQLTNIFYTNEKANLKPEDYIRGYVEKITDVVIGENDDKSKVIRQEVTKTTVIPPSFFTNPKAEEPAAPVEGEAPAEGETPAPAAEEKPKGKGKKKETANA